MAAEGHQFAVLAACNYGRLDTLRKLLDAGADPNEVDDATGAFPIHCAARGAHVECVRLLLERRANDPNCRNENGNTPLHYAAISGTKKVSQLLVAHGGDVNAANKAGQTPLHGAAGQNWDHIVAYLGSLRDDSCKECAARTCKKHMADVNARDNNGMTPLHYASNQFTSSLYEQLLALGADPSIKDEDGDLPVSPKEKRRKWLGSWGLLILAFAIALGSYLYQQYAAAREPVELVAA